MTLEIHKYDVPVRVGNSDWISVQVASVDKATAVANAKLRVEIGIPVEVCTCHCAACVAIRDTKAIIKDVVTKYASVPCQYSVSEAHLSFHDAVTPALIDYLVAVQLGYRITDVRESGTIYMQHQADKDFLYINSSKATDYNFDPSSDLNLAYALHEAAKAEKRFTDHGDLTRDYKTLHKVMLSSLFSYESVTRPCRTIPTILVNTQDVINRTLNKAKLVASVEASLTNLPT